MNPPHVPFFRPDIRSAEIEGAVDTLRSGWLTTGPKVRAFEDAFRSAVHGAHALAVNSCTAALHLAVDALGATAGEAVLVPTMTFAATAEVVRYGGATPVLVDCDPLTLNMDLADAQDKAAQLASARPPANLREGLELVGMMPVHVAGLMMDVDAIRAFAARHRLWVVEDAAHAFPAAWRRDSAAPWSYCGDNTADVSCFSFYANKTITTAEGGMAITADVYLLERMRVMALHGLSSDAWQRYSGTGSWDYRIVAPGFKYNLTDIAAAIGLHQLVRAEAMRARRQDIAKRYVEALAGIEELELPPPGEDRLHAWHLFPLRLRLDALDIDRAEFIREMSRAGIGCSVHWRPLHLHPYYRETFGWRPEEFPVATHTWERLVSVPIYSAMQEEDVETVVTAIRDVCARHALSVRRAPARISAHT